MPKVFIIILNYNGGDLLKNCLETLQKVQYPDLSLVVTDNNSKDDSLKMVERLFPKVTILRNNKNLGFAGGNNVGIRYALEQDADYVLLLNQDTEVESDFLFKLIDAAQKNPKVGIFSPLIFWKRTSDVWYSGGKINWLTMKSIHERKMRSGAPYQTGFITGCSMMVKKEVFSKIGLLSDKFFLYWEDSDFSYQAKKAGFSNLVVPESRIYHFEISGLPSGKKLYWLVLSGLIFFKRNTPMIIHPWIIFYTQLRKLKNKVDLIIKPNNNDKREVRNAYQDFKNGNY